MNSYPVNEQVRLSVAFTSRVSDPPNQPVDPTDVTLTLTPPNAGGELVFDYANGDIIRDDVGLYHFDYTIQTMGQWIYRWQGSGAVIASSGNGFFRAV